MRYALPIAAVLGIALSAPLHARGGASRVHYRCDAAAPRIDLVSGDVEVTGAVPVGAVESFDAGDLVEYGNVGERGEMRRIGSAAVERTCGRLKLRVRGGYYNANPMGEMGAAEDFPLVEVFDGEESLTGTLAIGACDVGGGRSGVVDCPRDWATEVVVFLDGATPVVRLHHAYTEFRRP